LKHALGPDHPYTVLSRDDLTSAYRDADRTGEARDLNPQPSDP
jgi:hypothetical protein